LSYIRNPSAFYIICDASLVTLCCLLKAHCWKWSCSAVLRISNLLCLDGVAAFLYTVGRPAYLPKSPENWPPMPQVSMMALFVSACLSALVFRTAYSKSSCFSLLCRQFLKGISISGRCCRFVSLIFLFFVVS
jgi:hypothetical protein